MGGLREITLTGKLSWMQTVLKRLKTRDGGFTLVALSIAMLVRGVLGSSGPAGSSGALQHSRRL